MDDRMVQAINEQINAELYSAYLYYSMSTWFADQNWMGLASWMKVQTREEQGHAEKLAGYLIERNQRVLLTALEGPPTAWDSVAAAFGAALEHEQFITGRINKLVDLAREVDDKATELFLGWYITEQVEEEGSVQGVLDALALIGSSAQGMFMLDRGLGQRE